MIRIEILPSFINASTFEIKQQENGYRWTMIQSAYAYTEHPGKIWAGEMTEAHYVNEIRDALLAVAAETPERGIVLDGVQVNCTMDMEGTYASCKFHSPDEGSPGQRLIALVLARANALINDQAYINYAELLEGYFFGTLPAKTFEEDPFRLRLYGSLSSYHKEALEQLINEITPRKKVLLDMTNFMGMGTILSPCFRPLFDIPDLTVMIKAHALPYVTDIGFNNSQIKIV